MHQGPVNVAGRDIYFTCHSGLLDGRGLVNSLDSVAVCLEAGAYRIEVDIHSLAADDYLVSHASRLEESTTSHGAVGSLTLETARSLRRSDHPASCPPLLSEVVAAVLPYSSHLQLDLKDWRPLTPARVDALISLLEPLGDRALVSSGQDWNLRAIHARSKELALGFDPDHYLAAGSRNVPVPARLGAYGYRDDHPLAIGRAQTPGEYLAERIGILVQQCPFATEFFIEKELILQAAGEGVSLADLFHERGVRVSAWTLDYQDESSLQKLVALAEAGVDCVTTNTSQQFAKVPEESGR